MVILSREQLEERLAALHRASLELVQDISLESLLERIAMVAREQVGARYAAVGVMDEKGYLEQFIPIGMLPEEIMQMDHPPVGQGLIGALMHARQPIRLVNIPADRRSAGFPPHHPAMTSFLGVPIRLGERSLGQIYLTNKIDAAEFSSDDEQVIETLAAYAAVAISNARLYKDLRERGRTLSRLNENLALLNRLATMLASSPEINDFLDKALSRVVEYLGVEAGEVYLREEDGRSFYLALQHSSSLGKLWTRDRFLVGQGLVGATAKSGQIRLAQLPDSRQHYLRKKVYAACVRQIACFPMAGRGGVLGVLCIATCSPRPIDDMEMQLLTSIASWTGTALENERLNVQGRRLAVLEERERIGMDLHDGIIQSIYGVGLSLEHARLLLVDDKDLARSRIEQSIAGLNSTIRDIRAYILDLKPRQLREENLFDGLQRLVTEFRNTTSIEASIKGAPEELDKLPAAQAIALFHICQEGLANVAKHSHAHRVDIFIWVTTERVLLEMHDDGRGFDLESVTLTIGHGLANMQTRAHNVGGDVEITSEPGKGTTILAWVPIFAQPAS